MKKILSLILSLILILFCSQKVYSTNTLNISIQSAINGYVDEGDIQLNWNGNNQNYRIIIKDITVNQTAIDVTQWGTNYDFRYVNNNGNNFQYQGHTYTVTITSNDKLYTGNTTFTIYPPGPTFDQKIHFNDSNLQNTWNNKQIPNIDYSIDMNVTWGKASHEGPNTHYVLRIFNETLNQEVLVDDCKTIETGDNININAHNNLLKFKNATKIDRNCLYSVQIIVVADASRGVVNNKNLNDKNGTNYGSNAKAYSDKLEFYYFGNSNIYYQQTQIQIIPINYTISVFKGLKTNNIAYSIPNVQLAYNYDSNIINIDSNGCIYAKSIGITKVLIYPQQNSYIGSMTITVIVKKIRLK